MSLPYRQVTDTITPQMSALRLESDDLRSGIGRSRNVVFQYRSKKDYIAANLARLVNGLLPIPFPGDQGFRLFIWKNVAHKA